MKQVLALSYARKFDDGRAVLDDVTLALLPGAKIGVVSEQHNAGRLGDEAARPRRVTNASSLADRGGNGYGR